MLTPTHDSLRAKIERLVHGSSWCGRCGRPWSARGVEPHTVWLTPTSGCFALCEPCWQASTPEERVEQMLRGNAEFGWSEEWELLAFATLRPIPRMRWPDWSDQDEVNELEADGFYDQPEEG